MRPMYLALASVAIIAVCHTPPVAADTPSSHPTDAEEPTSTWECPQADGTVMYTNKEKPECRALTLKPLSVVPNLEHMPVIPHAVAAMPPYPNPSYLDRYPGSERQPVPEWARDWRASIAPEGSAQEEVCSLFSEWMHLVQKTRGGFFYGTDPSYGGDVTGRNQWVPSQSFYDNARYIALSRIFGTGFVPVGCR